MPVYTTDTNVLGRERSARGGTRGSTVGGESVSPFQFPTEGATDVIVFDANAGDITSEILGDVYVAQGDPVYRQSGPPGTDLFATTLDGTDDYFVDTSPNSAIFPGSSSFVAVFQARFDVSASGAIYLADFDGNGTAATTGWWFLFTGVQLEFAIIDDSLTLHRTRYDPPSTPYDGLWHTYRWIFDKTQDFATLEIDGTAVTTFRGGATFSSLGAVNPSGGLALAARENDGTLSVVGEVSQVAFAIGSTTYDVTLPP